MRSPHAARPFIGGARIGDGGSTCLQLLSVNAGWRPMARVKTTRSCMRNAGLPFDGSALHQ
jgi:hypothetical protein